MRIRLGDVVVVCVREDKSAIARYSFKWIVIVIGIVGRIGYYRWILLPRVSHNQKPGLKEGLLPSEAPSAVEARIAGERIIQKHTAVRLGG